MVKFDLDQSQLLIALIFNAAVIKILQ